MLRGKTTEKVTQYRHDTLSTWGVGADLSEQQWRAVLRQLIALGHVLTEGEYHTLVLTGTARAVLKGEVELMLRVSVSAPAGRGKAGAKSGNSTGSSSSAKSAKAAAEVASLDLPAQQRFESLKAWRSEVAREHSLPAYVIFQNVTLAEMARLHPQSLDELAGITGVGAKKLEAYGEEILRVLGQD